MMMNICILGSIEQKTTNKNPRSTVGTVTEVYDFVRLLYARVGTAYSHLSGERMVRFTEEHILELIEEKYHNKDVLILAPLVKARKGHYRELFAQLAKKGFLRVRVDGEVKELTYNMQVDRYKTHSIELVIDRLRLPNSGRLKEAVRIALKQGKGVLMVMEYEQPSPIPKPSPKPTYFSRQLMDPSTGLSYPDPEPNTFSFNSPYGACPKCNGLGEVAQIDLSKLIPDPKKSIREGAFEVLGKYSPTNYLYRKLEILGRYYHFTIDDPVETFSEDAMNAILYGTSDYTGMEDAYEMNHGTAFQGIVNYIMQMASDESSAALQKWAASFMNRVTCPECHGQRLRQESLCYKLNDTTIAQVTNMDISQLYEWTNSLSEKLDSRTWRIAEEIVKEISKRIKFLLDVGLDYLTLDRPAVSLSGGENQRIRLATQIGSQLVNVLYILDEPSIGLHQRDNERLINSLKELRDIGNTVIVVEHDRDIMTKADYIVDIGPLAGRKGGEVMFQGTPQQLLQTDTITAKWLRREEKMNDAHKRMWRMESNKKIVLHGLRGNNLKNIDVEFPLEKFICVTGVSGSGKSTIVNETLQPILSQHFYRSNKRPLDYDSIEGMEYVDKVVCVDQSPIGKTPRSNPATYTGVFNDIRNLFVELPESKMRGYKPGRFSFNVKGGRCEACSGNGYKNIVMNFLPDIQVKCEVCHGQRYNRPTLEVKFKGKSIADVLDMTINQAVEFFENQPNILNKIKVLQMVGLGYVKLGQSSTTLSGGESQRVKLATELAKRDTGKTVFILDEPTTGLHFADIQALLDVLNRLVEKGNTVIVIEHNLDVIANADHIIDIGPEGGVRGGKVVVCGSPEEVAKSGKGITAAFIKEELEQIKNPEK